MLQNPFHNWSLYMSGILLLLKMNGSSLRTGIHGARKLPEEGGKQQFSPLVTPRNRAQHWHTYLGGNPRSLTGFNTSSAQGRPSISGTGNLTT